MVRCLCLLMLLSCLVQGEDTLADVIKKTDMSNADAVYALAEWCAEHNKPTTARQYYGKCIEIDKDHEAARYKLGQVKVGDRWVAAAAAGVKPPGAKDASSAAAPTRGSSGPGPAAKDVAWDLTLPASSGDASFVDAQIERMNHAKNDSDEMDSAVLTLMRADCRAQLMPHLCAALLRTDFADIYGACQIMLKLVKEGHRNAARRLLGFIARSSEHNSDNDDLETFAFAGPMMHDRRLVPRLIELMDSASPAVKKAATEGVASLILLPLADLTTAKAKAWWDLNWNIPERQVLGEQLRSSDPHIAIEAAKGLYDLRDKSMVPVVIKLLKSDDHKVVTDAIEVIIKITGNDWSFSADLPADKRTQIIANLDKWWKENQNRFEWIEDRNAVPAEEAKAVDPQALLIQQLASVEGKQSEQAYGTLRSKGKEAVPALIAALHDRNTLIRLKCNDILKAISKQDFKFDAHADDDKLAAAIEQWRQWAIAQKIPLGSDDDQGVEGDPAPGGVEKAGGGKGGH
jgi:hypothetical protein